MTQRADVGTRRATPECRPVRILSGQGAPWHSYIRYVLLLLLLLGESCARVGDPLPPLLHIPRRTTDLSVRQIDNEIVLSIPKPTVTTEATEIRRLKEIRILRMARQKVQGQPVPPVDENVFRSRSSLLTALPYRPDKGPLSGDAILYREPVSPFTGELLLYAVEFVGKSGRSEGISNIVTMEPLAIPSAPVGLRAEVLEDRIRLEWDRPEINADGSRPACLAGYRLYRSEKDPPEFSTPLQPEVVKENRFDDMEMVFGKAVSYAVQIVGCSPTSIAESRLSEPLRTLPQDVFAPAVPSRLEAFDLAEGISLRWNPNREADLAGYRVYRSESMEDQGRLVHSEPIQEDVFLDKTAETGNTYYYRLSAVDRTGNESKTTPPVSTRRETPPKPDTPSPL